MSLKVYFDSSASIPVIKTEDKEKWERKIEISWVAWLGFHAFWPHVFLGGGNLKKMPKKNKNVESGLKSETIGWFSLRVGAYDVVDPVEEFTHFDIDSGVVGKGTPLTPRHQAMDFSETHQGAAGVSLSKTVEVVLAGVCTDVFFHLPPSLRCTRLCLLPYIRHTPSCAWSCQDRLFHSPHHSL